ncbi:MAG: Txe/YoeB family addiction module toxin [Candidatus Caenarcaniphilales bacterium]|nr:Txe/YoeB family addiction module toxin [Candidatus Caenarcaniphilales bacterium]
MREIIFAHKALKQLQEWKNSNLNIFEKIIELIENIKNDPFNGLGKPEPLKYDKQGYWSRRINREHRLVYKITDLSIIVVSCRFYYD